jgi:hypothetical protein
LVFRRTRVSSRLVDAPDALRSRWGCQVTISSQLGQQPAQSQFPASHISNIGYIRNTVHARGGLVHDYPDHETAGADFHDEDGYDEDWDQDDYDEDRYGALAWSVERRWRPVAAFIGCVVALGAIATAVVINSGDTASTKATVGAPTPRTAIAQTTQAPAASTPKPAKPQPPPETVTTVAPPSAAPSPTALPPAATLDPRTVVYSVNGTKQLLDLVSIVYTDARGLPQTEFNVALPWSKMIVLNPGVQNVSVVATSIYSHLDCAVFNAAGQTVVASANNASIATCTR